MADVSAPTPLADDALETTDLNITGMSCAACARRIERQLGRTPGVVAATVNFATSRARVVTSAGGVPTDKVIGVVEQTGFGASVITSPADALRAQQQAALAFGRDQVVQGLAKAPKAPSRRDVEYP